MVEGSAFVAIVSLPLGGVTTGGDGDNALNDWLPPYNGAAGYFGAGYPTATWAAASTAR